MMNNDLTSKINLVWPVVGCSNSCPYCYARAYNNEHKLIEIFECVTLMDDWKEQITKYSPAVYMVTGLSDLSDWPMDVVTKIFDVCEQHPENQYLFSTKHPEKIQFGCVYDNVWLGATVTNQADKEKIDVLRTRDWKHKYLAFEPLHEDLGKLNLEGIEWVSVGRELGDRYNKINIRCNWVRNIEKQLDGRPILMKSSLKHTMGSDFKQQLPEQIMSCITNGPHSENYSDIINKMGGK